MHPIINTSKTLFMSLLSFRIKDLHTGVGMADKKKKYIQKLKDTSQYDKFKESHANYMRSYRQKMSLDNKERQNELSKQRMKRYRERQKEKKKELENNLGKRRMTRQEEEKIKKQRDVWKIEKQNYRRKLQEKRPQKVRRIKEKEAKRKRESRQLHATTKTDANDDNDNQGFSTPGAKRKAVERLKKCIPKRCVKTVSVVAQLIKSASPRKRKMFEEEGIYCEPIKKRPKMQVSNTLWSKKRTRKTRKDAVQATEIEAVHVFYERSDISNTLPNKKCVSKKTQKPKMILQRSLRQTYKIWKTENPNAKLKLSKFIALRPKHVRPQREAKLYQCLCIYCTNIDFKIESLNKLKDLPAKIKGKYALLDQTLCEHEAQPYHNLLCIDRRCHHCPKTVASLDALNQSTQIEWKLWERSSVEGSTTKRMEIRRKNGTVADLLRDLWTELQPFSRHLFQASWQQSQLTSIMKDIPKNTVVTLTVIFF